MRFVPGIAAARRHATATYLPVGRKGLVARRDGDRIALPVETELTALGVALDGAHRLGSLDDTDALVVVTDLEPAPPFEAFDLRALARLIDRELFPVVARALHAYDWLTTSRFCGRCGAATERSSTERCSVCPRCDLHVYPRISPAIITLVRRGDEALLASNARFPGLFYSTLAGFSDIGESLEETLVREVKEEVGLDVGNLRYFGSQPWPFPNSLMIGFTADWLAGEIEIDRSELHDARWFTRDALPKIPPPLSIARSLIDAWLAG